MSADAPPIDVTTARRCYAEELRFTAPVRANEAIVAAFATVPREAFIAPGPWRLMTPMGRGSFMSPDADPRHLYHDVLVAIDEARDLNNGQPSLWAFLYDQLEIRAAAHVVHVGCGTGYYSAILAELVGAAGRVSAYEVDPDLAAAARANLAPWPQAQLFAGDGAAHDPGACDVIVANAGVTHPAAVWLDALVPGGRLLMPLTGEHGRGAFLKVERTDDGYAAAFVSMTGIFHCAAPRELAAARGLADAFRRSGGALPHVGSLRRGGLPDRTCWFAGPDFWLSTAPP